MGEKVMTILMKITMIMAENQMGWPYHNFFNVPFCVYMVKSPILFPALVSPGLDEPVDQ